MIMFNSLIIDAKFLADVLTIQKNIDVTFDYISENNIIVSNNDDIKLVCIDNEIYEINIKPIDEYSLLINNELDIISNNNYSLNLIKNIVTIGNINSIINLTIKNTENLNKIKLNDIIIHKLNNFNCEVECNNVRFTEINNEFYNNSYFDTCIFDFGEITINNKTILKDCVLSNIHINIVGSIEIYNSKLYNVEISGGTCLLNGCDCQNVNFDNTIIKGFLNNSNNYKIKNSSYTGVNDNINNILSKNGQSIRLYDSNIKNINGNCITYNIENTNLEEYKITGDVTKKKTIAASYALYNVEMSLHDYVEKKDYICLIPESKIRNVNPNFTLDGSTVFSIYNKYNNYLKYYIDEIDNEKYLFIKNTFYDINDIITIKKDISSEISYKDDVIFNYLYICDQKDRTKFDINYDDVLFENNSMKLDKNITGKINYLLNQNESIDIITKNEENYPINISININDKIYNKYKLDITNNKIIIGE